MEREGLQSTQTKRIDRGGKLPLYRQLYEILRGKILRGEWQPGDTILPESALIERYEASQIIRAIPASRDLARALSIPPQSALLYVERVSYSQHDIPVEFLRIYYRGDRYVLYSELHD